MTHICVSNLAIIDSDNGLSPGRRQAIISTNAGTLLILTLGTNFSEILSEIQTFSFFFIQENALKHASFSPSQNINSCDTNIANIVKIYDVCVCEQFL